MTIDVDLILAAINQALPIAEMLAKLTTTLWDDRAVALMKMAKDTPQIVDLLRVIFNDPAVQMAVGDSARTLAIAGVVEAQGHQAAIASGLTIVELIQYASMVYALIQTILGKRK